MKSWSQSHLQPWNRFSIPVFFIVFLLVVYSGVIESRSLVKTLPGLSGDLPFRLETGYIDVGESNDVQWFYYFVESEGNPKNDPLMLWLTAGPGCSALSTLVSGIGPLIFNKANSTLEKPILEINPDRWIKVANILYVDHPAGAGFSYAKTREAYITNDTLSTTQVYDFLKKWLVDHPKFLNNPFYLGADSYNGILVPMILKEIYNGNEVGEELQINVKGYILGNPLTDIRGDYNSRIPFSHRVALLSDAIYKSAKQNCHGEYLNVDPNNSLCIHDLEVVDKCLRRINKDYNPLITTWANRKDVREALHIREVFDGIEWVRCNATLAYDYGKEAISYKNNVPSTVSYHKDLTYKNCRALIFSGDHDMTVSYLGTLKWIESLNLLIVNEWRPWFVNEQVAGYTMKYSTHDYNLTFATVKGGGHHVRLYKPKECSSMFMSWLVNDTL